MHVEGNISVIMGEMVPVGWRTHYHIKPCLAKIQILSRHVVKGQAVVSTSKHGGVVQSRTQVTDFVSADTCNR